MIGIVWEPRKDGQRHASTTSFGWNERKLTSSEKNAVLDALQVEEKRVGRVIIDRSMVIAEVKTRWPWHTYEDVAAHDVEFFKNYPKF